MSSDEQQADDGETRVFRQRFRLRKRVEGRRLDQYLAAALPEFSRSQLQRLIREGQITVNGERVKPSYAIRKNDVIDVTVEVADGPTVPPEDIPLDILYEDDQMIVVNKPPDMVVHPAKGHQGGTLVNALLGYTQSLASSWGELRAGIVHRLDRDTSGVIVTARTDAAQSAIGQQFQARTVEKHYLAVVVREPELDADLIDLPIGRHPRNPEAGAIRRDGKPSQSIYRVQRRFRGFAELDVQILTGRTHQIRIHLAHLGHPVVADGVYGDHRAVYRSELLGRPPADGEAPLIDRQALHAHRIALDHPVTGERMGFTAPLPADMRALLDALAELRGK